MPPRTNSRRVRREAGLGPAQASVRVAQATAGARDIVGRWSLPSASIWRGRRNCGTCARVGGCLPEYWETGKPRLEADVQAVCEGLLSGGASELVVIDNHGGNTVNVSPEVLPPGARLERWRDFDLRSHAVDATFQVGYHPRGGVEGFLSHTYILGLRLRLNGELISESHGRA